HRSNRDRARSLRCGPADRRYRKGRSAQAGRGAADGTQSFAGHGRAGRLGIGRQDPPRRRPAAGLDDEQRQSGALRRSDQANQGKRRQKDRRRSQPADVHSPGAAARGPAGGLREPGLMVNLKNIWQRIVKAVNPSTGAGLPRGTPGIGSPINTLPGIIGTNPAVNLALQSAAGWACCRLISNSIATLPSQIFELTGDGKVPALNHPLYGILTRSPNPHMTVQQWLQPTLMSLLLYGNGFTWKDTINGEVVGLWPLHPSRVQIILQ